MANTNENKKYHYLYKTTNLINGKYYYGMHSTNNIDDGYLGSGSYLRNAINKHGKDNFKREIIKYFDNREELVQAEINLITNDLVQDKLCMNLKLGGDGGSLGMINVKDKNGNTFSVFCDDPRYLSGELVSANKGLFMMKDKNGNHISININDERYLSGELVGTTKNKFVSKDINGNIFQIDLMDPRYLSGELVGISKNMIPVKDKNGNTLQVDKNDERYLSGELVSIWKDRKHTEETKEKIGKSNSTKQKGENNSQFGTCWITKDSQNKKIKKEELETFINQGWCKGRK